MVEVDRSWYYLYNCKVTLSLKKSDMIKSDRFWHRINKIKTVAGLRRSLNCSKAFNLKQDRGFAISSLQALPLHATSLIAANTQLRRATAQSSNLRAIGRLWRPSSISINGRLRINTECAIKPRFARHIQNVHSECAINVLSMCYQCAINVLSMCYQCAIKPRFARHMHQHSYYLYTFSLATKNLPSAMHVTRLIYNSRRGAENHNKVTVSSQRPF